jgi:phenylacetate-coenzyme A ligase PaaK-like adenylate-forming protein
MTKADLMAHWDEIVTDRRLTLDLASAHLARIATDGSAYLLNDYQVVASSGSTGVRGVFVWDFDGLLLSRATHARHRQWLMRYADLAPTRRDARIMAAHGTHLSTVLGETFAGPSGATRSLPVTLPLAEIVAGLNDHQPEAISAYPSALHRLALEAQAGRLRISPRGLTTAAEPLLPEARAVISETFRVPVVDLYGCSETGVAAVSYPGSTPLHLIEDIAVYEPVDRAGRPVPPGVPAAKMLITNVINQVLPLIRYEITDEVTFLAEPNPDPWTGRRIAPVPGRLDDTFVYDAGVEVHPHVFRSALGGIPAICEYQVRQTPRGASILVCAAQTENLEPVRRHLVGALARLGLVAPEVSIEAVDHLDRVGGTGKLKRFVPLPAADHGRS